MTTRAYLKRAVSAFLAFAIILGCIPAFEISLPSFAADGNVADNRVTDPSTLDGWKAFFGPDVMHTTNAGGVWLDKTVLTDTSAFPNSVTMSDAEKNFLVALSAIAANKEIVGYSTIPTDTMLVLDVSGSMGSASGSSSIDELVTAANSAIKQLLEVNRNNRIGVVLYSGNSGFGASTYAQGTTLLLPLDRYSLRSGTAYLNGSNNGSVSVNNQVRNDDGDPITASKEVEGGTYIQSGLYEALKQFEAADPVIGGDNFQDGQQRLPIMVLMSDGAPTTATNNFAEVDKTYTAGSGRNQYTTDASVAGNGGATSDSLGFLTQLTASYVLNRMENHYDCAGRGLFYTLGLGVDSVSGSAVAESVLDPENSTDGIDGYWEEYLELSGTAAMTLRVPGTSTNSNNNGTKEISVYKNSYATVQNYVDKYFEADSNQELNATFAEIVQEIIIQSRYYATHLEGGTPDLSGYITFEDEIGAFMEVKDIKGILLGDTLFTGAMLTSMLNSNQTGGLGTVENPSDLGLEFRDSVKDRLGIADNLTAINLINAAYQAGQLSYTSDTEFSNHIGWYAGADGGYVGFWNEGITDDPASAVYKIKSYGFLGQASGNIKDSDMMYMTVQVRTHIATGEQSVVWKIPAALLPMVTYKIELDGNSEATATNVELTREGAEPIRLLFETGLRDNINELNVGQITDPKHVSADGSRVFWTNHWDISAADHEHHVTTTGTFTPSEQNERFYYTTDAVIYELSGGNYVEVPSSQALDPDKTYYHARYVFRSGMSTAEEYFEPIAAESLALAQKDTEEGNWYIPLGTVYRYVADGQALKTQNATGSAQYSAYSHIERSNASYEMWINLGNNGMLKMVPATGIKLSKTVTMEEPGVSTDFQFKITLKNANGSALTGTFDTLLADLDATIGTAGTVTTNAAGEVTVDLAAGKTIYITGLPAGATYTVEEVSSNADYKVQSAYVNGVHMADGVASGALTNRVLDDVDFVNEPTSEGDLIIRKTVTHPFGAGYVIPAGKEFTINVTLTGAEDGVYEAQSSDNSITSVTVQNGKFSVKLEHGESVVVHGLKEEATYVITETEVADDGFTLNETASSGLEGAILGESNVQAILVNDYAPAEVSVTANIEISKLLSGRPWLNTDSFRFVIEQVDGNGALIETIETVTIDSEGELGQHVLTDIYTEAGSYYYRIREVVGATDQGITYDTAYRYFSVTVADVDMDGKLEIVSVANVMNTTVTQNNGYIVEASFSNSYAAYTGTEITVNVEKAMAGNSFPLNGFQFGLYSDAACTQLVVGSTLTNSSGEAVFELAYSVNAIGTHTYYLKEIDTGIPGMIYSDKVYQVEVTVTDNFDGTISAATTIQGLEQGETIPTFTNTYNPEDATLVLSGNKALTGRVHNAGEFSFRLYQTDSSFSISGLDPIQTVTNAVNGDFIFQALTFTAPGTYYYVVNEAQGSLGGITYDTKEYQITVTVTDNNGVLAVTTQGMENGLAFSNSYDPEDAEVILSGNKILTGRDLQDGEFEFVLTPDANNPDGDPVTQTLSVKNVGAGFAFDKLTYAKTGVYTYTVSEVKGSLGGVIYDEAVYTVTVTITDDSAGKLHASIAYQRNGAAATDMVFRNGYAIDTPYEIEIEGDKILAGRDLTEGEFEFVLLNALTGEEIARAKNDANGKFVFAPYSVRVAGVYYFDIIEVNDGQPGMDYDVSVIEVVVTLVDNGDGTLSESGRTVTKSSVRSASVSFTNIYHYGTLAVQKEVAHTLGANQQMTDQVFEIQVDLGRALAGKIFAAAGAGYNSITLDADGQVILQLAHGETVDIYGLPEGTVATITELNTPADYSQSFRDSDGSNDGIVTIVRNATVSVDVVNLYAPTYDLPATVVVGGNKIFTGRGSNAWLSTDSFTVKLQQWNGSAWVDVPGAQEVLTDSNREYAFDLNALGIKYTAPGRYSYQVVEVIPEEADRIPGVTYDRTLHTFTVVVEDPEMKGLVITSVIADETDEAFTKNGDVWSKTDFNFNNTYSTSGSVAVDIDVQKGATNYGGNPVNLGQFQFKLSPVNGTPGTVMTVYADSIGEARFFLTFTAEGTYEYTLEEVNGGLYGMEYDPKDYAVTIQVSDNHQGGLKADVTIVDGAGNPYDVDQELLFVNTYDPDDTTLDFDVSKELTGRDLAAGEFDFILKQWLNGHWEQIAAGTNDAQGKVTFTALAGYSLKLDKVGTYFYQISEDPAKTQPGVANDARVYNVAVTVTDNNGKLEASYRVESLTDTHMVFTNVYDAEDTRYVPTVEKKWDGGNGSKTALTGGEFRFQLKRDGVLIGTGINDANGKVIFAEAYNDAFVISKAGEYQYTITEVAGSNPGITYDDTVYAVTVTVVDDTATGKLKVDQVVGGENIIFTNRYTAKPAELVLDGQKNYNLPLTGGEFTFELYDADGKLIQSVKNGAHNKFVFDKLIFNAPGEYKYTVKELKPVDALESITYDETVHDVIVKVADNGQGQLYVESINENAIAALNLVFTNFYDAKDTQFVPTVNKVWDKGNGEKTALTGGEFRFQLERNGVLIGTGINDANGQVIFTEAYANAFIITEAGNYTYTITEVNGGQTLNGVTYDDTIRTVKITVTDNTKIGELEISSVQGDNVSFTNRYEAKDAELTLEGQKNYNLPLSGGEFTFELYDAQGKLIDYVQNDGNKKFVFKKLTFSAPGEYKYTVKEYKPDDASPSITYDEKVHEITVKVADDRLGQLFVEQINGKAVDELNLTFTNVYKALPTQFVPTVNKLWDKGNGEKAALAGGEFSFQLMRDGVLIGNGINDASGKVTFTEVYTNAFAINAAGDYTYTITEVNGGQVINGVIYDGASHVVKITVVDNTQTGKLEINGVQGDNVSFTNSYEAKDAELTLEGEKNYNLPLTGGEFTFELYDTDGKLIQSVKNDGNNKFAFDKLTFSAPGEYKYTVKELKPANALVSIRYDETVHEIIVKVSDNGQGQLYVESINGDEPQELDLVFTNHYDAKDTQFVPTVNKIWDKGNGEKSELVGGEFRFELKRNGVLIGTGINDANGKVIFTEAYAGAFVINAAGDYTFVITEVNGGQTLNGVTYDDALHVVKITVTDNTQIGELQITDVQGDNVSFTNSYEAKDTELTLEGKKNYNLPLTGGEFIFELYDAQGQLIQSVKNDGNSKFAFDKLTFSAPGEYQYTVKEYKPDDASPSITYDEKIYEINVKVTDDQLGQLFVEQINGKAVNELNLTFTNVYKALPTQFVPTVSKLWDKGNGEKTALVGGEFRFELKRNDTLIGTGINDANGKVIFTEVYAGAFVISEAGDYTYTITEVNGGQTLNGVTYDDAVHVVKITVVDNTQTGKLEINGVQGDNVSFTNRYEAKDAELTLEGEKNYNLPLTGGEFTFELYDAQGQLLQSVKNDGNNKFAFDKLTFSASGEYKYTVKELRPDDASPSITYDEKVYEIIVKVSDNKQGQLFVEQINGEAVEDLSLTFTNVYTKPADITLGLDVTKTVENKGTAVKGPDGFVFILKNEAGEEIGRIVSDEDGKVSFESLIFTEADIGKTFVYTICEEKGDLDDMEYDETVHTITIVISLSAENKLVATVNGAPASVAEVAFTNVNNANVPYTGDHSNPMMWIALLFVTGGVLAVLTVDAKRKQKNQ